MKKNQTADLVKLTADVPSLIDALESEIAEVVASMVTLKKAGLIYATEHWRKGSDGQPKYLYLLYQQKNGEPRRRDYVGCDSERIQEAHAGIVRAEQYGQLAAQYSALESRVRGIDQALQEARSYLANN